MRFAMKSRRGPHVPIGHNAPKELKEEIDNRLTKVQDIKFEPRLLSEEDARLHSIQQQETRLGCYNYLYRMKALDAVQMSDIPFHESGKYPRSLIGKNFRSFLLEMKNSNTPLRGRCKNLIDILLDSYEAARHGTGVFEEAEYLKFQEALNELSTIAKAHGTVSQRQHQSAAKDLTISTESSPPSTIQVTYLPSSQKSKRAKHFLELKSFKDKYNTLESTL